MPQNPEAKDAAAGDFHVTVRTLAGKAFRIDTAPSDSVERLKQLVHDKEGFPRDQQRLIAGAVEMTDDARTLAAYGVQSGQVVTLVLRLRDIGVWTSPAQLQTQADPLRARSTVSSFLLHPKGPAPPALEVAELVRSLKAEKSRPAPSQSASRLELSEVLSVDQRNSLIHMIDAAAPPSDTAGPADASAPPAVGRVELYGSDVQLVLSPAEARAVVGGPCWERLEGALGRAVSEVKVRRVTAQEPPQCIPFHLDHSERTLGVALNGPEEYQGGQIVFASDEGQLEMPSRPAGSATVHDWSWVHGVTALTRGVRYSVFLLARPQAEPTLA